MNPGDVLSKNFVLFLTGAALGMKYSLCKLTVGFANETRIEFKTDNLNFVSEFRKLISNYNLECPQFTE